MKSSLKEKFIIKENLIDDLFYGSLIEELNKLIEEELNKDYEEINAEIIDDCCAALNTIYELQNGAIQNKQSLVNLEKVIKKCNLKARKKYVYVAACAAIVVLSVGIAATPFEENISEKGGMVKSAVGKFVELIYGEVETTKTSTLEPSEEMSVTHTQEQVSSMSTSLPDLLEKEINGIAIICPPGFNSTVYSVEEISFDNFVVSINYADGERFIVPFSEVAYEVCETQADGLTEVKVFYREYSTSFYITILNEEQKDPVNINSIYGVFENGYCVEEMRVFAVFSNGIEKEIPKSECKITTSEFYENGEKETIVVVEYEDCSFSFIND